MAQVTKGIRSVLSFAPVYNLLMRALGSDRSRTLLIEQYLRPREGDRILDIGCGTGAILEFLPPGVDYHGMDLSAQYIAAARSRFGGRGNFQVGDVNELVAQDEAGFDIVMALGLLHHLEDEEVRRLAESVARLMAPTGRFITLDNCFTEEQSAVARTLISWDRGQNVRQPDQYQALLGEVFGQVSCDVRHDLLRFPYTHVIFEARR